MNKIVREHYPAANLPEDLREGLASDAMVRIVVEVEEKPFVDTSDLVAQALAAKPVEWGELMQMREKLLADGRRSVSTEEAVARIRELRDEWDY